MNKAYIPILFCVLSSCAVSQENITTYSFDSGVSVTLTETVYSKSQLVECEKNNSTCRTNGDVVFGSVNQKPTSYLKQIYINIDDKIYDLDTSYMYNAWAGKPKEVEGVIQYLYASCFDKNNCIVRGLFSDAAGSYIGEWKITNTQPYRTVLTSSNDLVKVFIKDINPPKYE